MKDELDNRWIGKMKELLEDYSPPDAPRDWKIVKRGLNRNRSWSAWLLMFLRRRGIYAFILGVGILIGFLLFNSPDKLPVGQENTAAVESSMVQPSMPIYAAAGTSRSKEKIATSPGFQPKKVRLDNVPVGKRGQSSKFKTDTIFKEQEKSIYSGDKIPAVRTENTAAAPARNVVITNYEAIGQDPKVIEDKKKRNPIKLKDFALRGDPWKVGIGYEYQYMIQPDTGKGILHELSIHFDKQVSNKFWVGSGITFGRTLVTRSAKFWVRDWSKSDSLGPIYLRDSSVFYQRWQNHITIPIRATYDLFRNRSFAIPVSAGAAFGWVYNQSHNLLNDGLTRMAHNGSTDGFTGFITADFSLGYEVFYLKGLSAVLSAEYRRMLIGTKSYGYGQNFIGYKIVLNLDFDKGKWR